MSKSHVCSFTAAITSGVLIALAVQILLSRHDIELTAVWRDFLSAGVQTRSAIAWWAIACAALLSSFVVAMLAYRFSWLYLRPMKWVLGLALVFALALVGHGAPLAPGIAAGGHLATSLAALAAALLMSSFGAYFAILV